MDYITCMYLDKSATLYYTVHRHRDGWSMHSGDYGGNLGRYYGFITGANQHFYAFKMSRMGTDDVIFKSDDPLFPLGESGDYSIIFWDQLIVTPSGSDQAVFSKSGYYDGKNLVMSTRATNIIEDIGGGSDASVVDLYAEITDFDIRLSRLRRTLTGAA